MRQSMKKLIGRIIVYVTAAVMIAVMFTSVDSKTEIAEASSLKHIDEVVAAGGTFTILEIVPDKAAASLGYYIDGQEPISDWKTTLSGLKTPEERGSYVNGLFTRLAAEGVLSNTTSTPLKYAYYDNNSYYTEAYIPGDLPGGTKLELDTLESKTVTGTFTEGSGDYRAEYAYTPAADGLYVQNISYFNFSIQASSGTYAYNPVFTEITAGTNLTGWDNVAIYTAYTDSNDTKIYTVGMYKTVKEILDNGGFDSLVKYYYVDTTQTGAPGPYNYEAIVSTDDDDDAPGDGYTEPTSGNAYFSRSITGYTYVGTGGNYTYSNVGGTEYTVHFSDIYYRAGFTNNNLFKQYVFGLADPTNNVSNDPDFNALDVIVKVKLASAVTASDISSAGMIYISSGTDITQSSVTTTYSPLGDIADTKAVQLYNYAANQNPVIIDYAIIQGITSSTPAAKLSAIEKLCLLTLQSVIAPTEQTSLSGMTVDWALLEYLDSDMDKALVNNSVFCFDPLNTESTANTPNIGAVVSERFNEAFAENVFSTGFSAVLAEIQNENFLKQIAGETNLLPENVTVGASIRHIINYEGRRQTNVKTSIKVLDIEPAKVSSSTWLKPETVSAWIGGTLPLDKITIVHMTTAEFVGKIEDINEMYDMIYLGMSVESLNTLNGSTVYNDTGMNGLVYANIGDTYYASIEIAGIRAQDYVMVNGIQAINGASGTTANKFRFSGNDITKTKVVELEKYALAGYPVILADGFVTGESINTNKVDNSSYMYEAVAHIYNQQPNVMTESYAASASNAATVIKYLNVSKPTIKLTSKPIEYEDNSSSTLTVDPNDGYFYLNYAFAISNLTDSTPVVTTYNCRLYIDLNADGKYSESEELGDIEVKRTSDEKLILPLVDGNGKEYYALSADVDYQVTRQMPDDYVGIIPWELEVIKNGADQIHASAEGFTRIASGGNSKTIKVLQIMQAGTSATKLNLAQQLVVNPAGTNLQLKGLDGNYYTGIYGKLIADLNDFEVSIDTIETNALEAIGDWATILDYLNGYDMLITGFNDCYDGIKANSATAIVDYIDSGKSVLFTHDTTSLTQVPTSSYPMAIDGAVSTLTLNSSKILYNSDAATYQNVASSTPNVFWNADVNSGAPPQITSASYQYVVFITGPPSGSAETDYFAKKAGSSGAYQIYKITGSSYTQITSSVTSGTSLETFKAENSITTPILYVHCLAAGGTYTNPNGNLDTTNQNIQATYSITKFVSSIRYNLNNYIYDYDVGKNGTSTMSSTNYTAHLLCLFKSTVTNYSYSGTYNSSLNTYLISGATWYPATGAAFPQSTLYSADPTDPAPYSLGTLPSGITDWGYYFNTVIRDAVGLDRYGVTSTIPVNVNQTLGNIVNVTAPMASDTILTVLNNDRGVAYTPKSGKAATVDEYQGYTNYALIRFAADTTSKKYTNNIYTNRETTNVSQVNKGQITTYPYNVNTASFNGNDSTIVGYGSSYMQIGKTHEQYFQTNMNADDIVVWYCMSNGGTDDISYYDDVPNDCVNAYYIYNKGNVTYSGVGHSSNASLYTGTVIGQEYINEAKLFVNTMIAAYQSGEQAPKVSIKKDDRGTSDLTQKFVIVDVGQTTSGDSTVMQRDFSATDESRAVYFRISDPNIGVSKTITAEYYVADENGFTVSGIDGKVALLLSDETGQPVATFNASGTGTSTLKGGFVYKFYLPNVNCLDRLASDDVYSFKIYIKVVTTIGTMTLSATDSVEIKKQQLFMLS